VVAAFLIYQLVFGLIAASMAWGMERLAVVLHWPRRGVWATSILATLFAPIYLTFSIAAVSSSIPGGSPEMGAALESPPPFPILRVPATSPGQTPTPEPALVLPAEQAPASLGETGWPVLRVPVLPQWDVVLAACCVALSLLGAIALVAGSLHLRRQIRGLPTQQIDGVTVRVAENLGPAVFGWFDPQIVLPRWLLDSNEHRSTVLAHERSHAVARDSLLFNLSLAVLALAPWNPVLWWQVLGLRFAIEVDCDRRVMKAGVDISRYARTLLQVAQLNGRTTFGTLALIEAASQLAARVHIMTVNLSRPAKLRLAVSALGILAVSVVCAASVEPPEVLLSANATPAPGTAQEAEEKLARDARDIIAGGISRPAASLFKDGGVRTGPESLSARAQELREALGDPERRRNLLQQERLMVERSNPDIIEVLQLDEPTSSRLFDLLAEQSLLGRVRGMENLSQQLERSMQVQRDPALRQQPRTDRNSIVADINEQRRPIKQLLGEAAYGRYLYYLLTVSARFEVARLTSRFGADALTPAQREQMIALVLEERRIDLQRDLLDPAVFNSAPSDQPLRGLPTSPQQIQELLWARQETARRKSEDRQRLLEASASILNPSQQAALLQGEAERMAQERDSNQKLRQSLDAYVAAAGSAALASIAPPRKRPLTGRLRWSLQIAVNEKEPRDFAFSSTLGESLSFSPIPRLMIEATPIAYDSEKFMVDMKIYEIGSTGARYMIQQVQPVFSSGSSSPPRPSEQQSFEMMPVGSEAYACTLSVNGSLR
jgi:hypothetical protein